MHEFVGKTRGVVLIASGKVKDAGDWITVHNVSVSCNTNDTSIRFRNGPGAGSPILYEVRLDATLGTTLTPFYLGIRFTKGLYVEFNGIGISFVNMTVEG